MTNTPQEMPLAERNCRHRRQQDEAYSPEEIDRDLMLLTDWQLIDVGEKMQLSKTIHTQDFSTAMQMAQSVAQLADEQDHHPQLIVEWGRLQINWWTHSLAGLSENDFIMAAKVDRLFDHE